MERSIALITGATRGIGRACAIALAERGVSVIAIGRNQTALEKTVSILPPCHHQQQHHFGVWEGACGEEDTWGATQTLFSSSLSPILAKWKEEGRGEGGKVLLVNSAGIAEDSLLPRVSHKHVQDIFSVNVFGTICMTRSFVREAIRLRLPQPPSSSFSPHPRQWVAHVVNIGSVVGGIGGAVGSMGEEGGGLPGQCVYAASKGAITAFSETLSREVLRYNIAVNTVSPWYVDTDMLNPSNSTNSNTSIDHLPKPLQESVLSSPFGGLIPPSAVGEVVGRLCGEEGEGVTGKNLVVDGCHFPLDDSVIRVEG